MVTVSLTKRRQHWLACQVLKGNSSVNQNPNRLTLG
jgi:hypothetical protein